MGLPGRGKSSISRKLNGFLNWKGYRSKIFNVGKYRRETAGGESAKADYFDPKNTSAKDERERVSKFVFTLFYFCEIIK